MTNVSLLESGMILVVSDAAPDKQVFPSLEFIGWYTVAQHPTARHIALHEQASNLPLSWLLFY